VTKVSHHSQGTLPALAEEPIRKVLKNFGLTEKEAEVYIFLAKHGVLKGGEIARQIKKDKAQVFRILKSLQTKGLVESTLEVPTRFTAVPFESVLDLSIKAKRDEAALIESTKKELLIYWKNISKARLEPPLEKFVVIEGSNKIYPKILQMMKETKNQLSATSTVPGLIRADQFGLFDAALEHPLRSKIQLRFITELTDQNVNAMKTLLKRKPTAGFNFKGRNPDLGLQLAPRMVIRDDEEIIFFITPRTDTSATEQEDVCLWTNCKALVDSFNAVFEDLWRNSTELERKIVELETGKPAQNTHVISDAEIARKKYEEILRSAKEEIVMVTSAEGIIAYWKKMAMLKEWAQKGISIRIMAPITSENLKAAKGLSKCGEIRHVSASYLETTIVDGKHLFQFKNRPSDEEKPGAQQYFGNAFYTNDIEYVEKTKNMLSDVWRNAGALPTVTLESVIGPKRGTVAQFPENPWKKISGVSIIEEEQGIITEKDILNKIINAQKIPAKDPSKYVNLYGSLAMAVIHPPDYFNLPEMIISAWHIDKQSSLGGEDMLCIHLWLETPSGHAYVPVATIGDNPQAVEIRKVNLSRTPAGQNNQLAKKDELYVRVHGNTMFAGWTVPIPLFPQPYTLPPACILFEGHGALKTGIFKQKTSWGSRPRTQIYEFNGFEAFVTFMHPAAKYAGPGTDGLLFRDLVALFSPNEKTAISLDNHTRKKK